MAVTPITYPIRINRYLYLKGYSSRRKADVLISEGKIFINKKRAVIGQHVQEGDSVTVSKSVAKLPNSYIYYLYNKPRGIVSHNPQKGEKSIEDVSGLGSSVHPVGRLDKDSHGLMLLTDDGRIVDKMLNPKFAHERVYKVGVDKTLTPRTITRMEKGVSIEGYMTRPSKVTQLTPLSFRITLTEGKKHQIRRMCAALGYQVKDLERISMMYLTSEGIPEGKYRELTDNERTELLETIQVPTPKE